MSIEGINCRVAHCRGALWVIHAVLVDVSGELDEIGGQAKRIERVEKLRIELSKLRDDLLKIETEKLLG